VLVVGLVVLPKLKGHSSEAASSLADARAACTAWNAVGTARDIATLQAEMSLASAGAAKAAQLDQRWDDLHSAMADAQGRINLAVQYKELGNAYGSIVALGQVLRAGPDLDSIASQCQVASA
jgi:hypothetical protein